MSVYVDKARHPFKGYIMCHMTADSLTELHEMADKLKVKRAYFQAPPKASFPHYDIPEARRALAISYGAREVNDRTCLHYAARLGLEWAINEADDQRLLRFQRTFDRTATYALD